MPEELLEQIAQCKPLSKRIRSFFVINLDFYFFNDNVFHFGKKNLMPIFKIMGDEDDQRMNTKAQDKPLDISVSPVANNIELMTLINELANRLFTVCAIHMEYPYI